MGKMQIKSKLATISVLASIFVMLWAARLAFIYSISDHWFGTLGLTSLILGTITYLSWKDKLGRYGLIYKRSLNHKIMKKLTKLRIISMAFTILMMASFSAGMHAAKDTYQAETVTMIKQVKEIKGDDYLTQERVVQETEQVIKANPWLYVVAFLSLIIIIPYLVLFHFPDWAVMMGLTNQVLGNQFIHIIDILLVEALELIGLMIFMRHIQKKSVVME